MISVHDAKRKKKAVVPIPNALEATLIKSRGRPNTSILLTSLHQAARAMRKEKKSMDSKNCARVGPEGQTRTGDSALCNAGLPPYQPVLLISGWSNKVSMKKKEEQKGNQA